MSLQRIICLHVSLTTSINRIYGLPIFLSLVAPYSTSFAQYIHYPSSALVQDLSPNHSTWAVPLTYSLVSPGPKILVSTGRPPVFFASATISKTYIHANLSFHSCCHPSITNHPWHLSPPTPPSLHLPLSCALSIALDGWPQVFQMSPLCCLQLHRCLLVIDINIYYLTDEFLLPCAYLQSWSLM